MRRSLPLNSLLLLSLCLATGALAGCGQKGPLYMPPPTKPAPAPASSTVKPAAPAPYNLVPNTERPASAQS
jgi:predicted small lipoprotein YifL